EQDYTFAGDTLSVLDGAGLVYKGDGGVHTITVNNLLFDGAVVRNTPNGGGGLTLAGNLHLATGGGILWNGIGGGVGPINLTANTDGVGPLALGGGPATVVTLSGTNT